MKIFKMIFHIALMAIVIFVLGYCLGLPMQKTEREVERKLGRRQQVVHYKGVSKEITDQYIEKYLVPIDEEIEPSSIVYYDEEEIIYNGEGYVLGQDCDMFMVYSSYVCVHTLSKLVEAYPDPILRDCGNGYLYAMYHTDNDNRLYVFIEKESNLNGYMGTVGFPVLMTERLSYSDFSNIKIGSSIDDVEKVDSVVKLYKNIEEGKNKTTVHLLTDGMLQINYVIVDGEYRIYEKKFDKEFFDIYRIYEQDYIERQYS